MKLAKITSIQGCMFKMAALILPLGSLFFSCNEKELLNPIPKTSLQDEYLFDTPERVLGQVNGMYAALKNGNFLGGRYHYLADVRGEEFINRTQNVFTGYDAWSHTVTSGSNDASSAWSPAYLAINSANLLIDGLAQHPNAVSAEMTAMYLAEAKFVRALSYFYLITRYGQPYNKDQGASPGIPLRLKGEKTPENNGLAKSTVGEVYTQILKDLDEAEANLPASYSTSMLNTTRAHKNTAISLKTRVYLHMSNYTKVVEESKKVVSDTAPFAATTGVKHTMEANISSLFTTSFTTVESILSMPMSVLNLVSGQNSLAFIYNQNIEYNLNPSGILGDASWRASDARKSSFVRVSGNLSYLKKYNQFSPMLDYIPIIRYSEVLLNYAEAAARTGDLSKATQLLNAVRQRSDSGYVFPESAVSTAGALIQTILQERRIELLGEGFRSNDLTRNLLTIPAKGSGGLSAPSVTPEQPEYVFPIPNSELSTNDLL